MALGFSLPALLLKLEDAPRQVISMQRSSADPLTTGILFLSRAPIPAAVVRHQSHSVRIAAY